MVRLEGTCQVSREIDHYNLDAILSVGYRVRSQRGTQFRLNTSPERIPDQVIRHGRREIEKSARWPFCCARLL